MFELETICFFCVSFFVPFTPSPSFRLSHLSQIYGECAHKSGVIFREKVKVESPVKTSVTVIVNKSLSPFFGIEIREKERGKHAERERERERERESKKKSYKRLNDLDLDN